MLYGAAMYVFSQYPTTQASKNVLSFLEIGVMKVSDGATGKQKRAEIVLKELQALK